MTVGPCHMVEFESATPLKYSAMYNPILMASVDVSLPIKNKGLFAFASISAALSNASSH